MNFRHVNITLIAIGFIADSITIISFGNMDGTADSISVLVIAFFVMTYVWFAAGWLILSGWIKKQSFDKYTFEIEKIALGLGAILYPVTFLIMFHSNDGNEAAAFFFLHILMALLIYVSLRFLFTSIYPDLNKIMKEKYDSFLYD